MRIALVGHLEKTPVEGTRRTLLELNRWLSRLHEVRVFRISSSLDMIRCISFKPDILHAVIGPSTLTSFLALRLWKLTALPKAIVVSATHFTLEDARLANRILKPDAILTQAESSLEKSKEVGWSAFFVPNGVDLLRFSPSSASQKLALRQEAGIPTGRRLLLHVGPIKYSRNVHWLTDLTSERSLLLILTRPTCEDDSELVENFVNRGAVVAKEFKPNVESIYQMADILVFPPTNPRSCVETPLSVLEAMSCNLPIVSTRFGALPIIGEGVAGLHFVSTREELVQTSLRLEIDGEELHTREAVTRYSWDRIADRISEIYVEVL